MVMQKQTSATDSSTAVPQVKVQKAQPPKGLDIAEQARLEQESDSVIEQLKNATEADEFELGDKIANVGLKAQRGVSSELGLMQESIGRVIGDERKSAVTSEITSGIKDLQESLEKINPASIQKEMGVRLVGMIPFFGKSAVRVLETAAMRRQTVAEFVAKIEESLQRGRDTLNSDNAQLIVLYRQLEEFRKIILKNIYFAELLAEKLDSQIAQCKDDPAKQQRLRNVLFRVSVRVQDLHAMNEVYAQFFTSITITRENNGLLIGSVDRMLSLGMNVVAVAFAIAAALAHQRDVLEAAKGTREFIGRMIVANAVTIRQHVNEIGDIYKQPVVAMEKLEKAHSELTQAIAALDQLKIQGIDAARQHTVRLREMTEELNRKSRPAQATETASLEAGDLPTKPVGGVERPML